jgi:branched-chain amino acid transport system permease protein
VMVFVGGAGSMLGPVLGAAFAVVLVEIFQDLGDYQAIAYGVALMLAITVLRGGLVSLGKEMRDSRLLGRLTGRRAEKGAVQRAQ